MPGRHGTAFMKAVALENAWHRDRQPLIPPSTPGGLRRRIAERISAAVLSMGTAMVTHAGPGGHYGSGCPQRQLVHNSQIVFFCLFAYPHFSAPVVLFFPLAASVGSVRKYHWNSRACSSQFTGIFPLVCGRDRMIWSSSRGIERALLLLAGKAA